MLNKKKNSFFQLDRFNLIHFLEGFDIFLNFSIVTFLSIFFLADYDENYSLPIIIFIICLSFFSRIFVIPLLKKLLYYTKNKKINCLYFLSLAYLIPVFLPNNFLIVSLLIFVFCRFSIGILFSSIHLNYFNSLMDKDEDSYFIKYSLTIIVGMVLANFLYLFIDDFFSNNQLNEWAWKVTYLILFLITVLISLVLKIKNKPFHISISYNSSLDEQLSLKKVKKFFFANIYILIPLFSFIFFFI